MKIHARFNIRHPFGSGRISKFRDKGSGTASEQHDTLFATGLLLAFIAIAIAFWMHPFLTAGAAAVLATVVLMIKCASAMRAVHSHAPDPARHRDAPANYPARDSKQRTQPIHL